MRLEDVIDYVIYERTTMSEERGFKIDTQEPFGMPIHTRGEPWLTGCLNISDVPARMAYPDLPRALAADPCRRLHLSF